jgi:UDP-N-acetylglucosamine acyltransferase
MNEIHCTAIIEGNVSIGENNKILPYTILIGPLTIGDNNIIGPNVVIGSPGQDTRNPRHDCSTKPIRIGSGNIIREFTAIQKPVYEDLTYIGNNVHLMQSVHIPHDAVISDHVVITPMVALAGLTKVLDGATLSLGVTVHQNSVIGHYSIVGMGASVLKNVKPFSRLVPGKPLSVNYYAIEKYGHTDFADEITKYITENKPPKSERLKKIMREFDLLHTRSGRDLY